MTSAGMDCLTESLPDGYGKLITQPLGLEGDINDARAPNSTVLEWYYQLAARWVPKLECSEYPREDDDGDTAGDNVPSSAAASETAATSALSGSASAAHIAGTATAPASTSGADSSASDAPASSATQRRLRSKSKARKNKVPSAMFPRPKAMSFHNYAGPGDLNRKQSSFVFTYQVSPFVLLFCSSAVVCAGAVCLTAVEILWSSSWLHYCTMKLTQYSLRTTVLTLVYYPSYSLRRSRPPTRSPSSGTPAACTTAARCCASSNTLTTSFSGRASFSPPHRSSWASPRPTSSCRIFRTMWCARKRRGLGATRR
jgi:hypothetical protein